MTATETPVKPLPNPDLAAELAELLHLDIEQLRPLPRVA